jgi:hypothetical protein
MPTGNNTYKGIAIPLNGESMIQQETLGNDIFVIQGAGSQAGDFIVCRDSSESEKMVITKDGNLTCRDLVVGGAITGTVTGAAETTYATSLAISPAVFTAKISKADAAADTLAAPGAANWPKLLLIYSSSAAAHVITVTGLVGGNTITLGGAIGDSVVLKAISATEWVVFDTNNATVSTVA